MFYYCSKTKLISKTQEQVQTEILDNTKDNLMHDDFNRLRCYSPWINLR